MKKYVIDSSLNKTEIEPVRKLKYSKLKTLWLQFRNSFTDNVICIYCGNKTKIAKNWDYEKCTYCGAYLYDER